MENKKIDESLICGYFVSCNRGIAMGNKYTKDEICAMADRCCKRCKNGHCENFETEEYYYDRTRGAWPITYSVPGSAGCRHLFTFPWSDVRWCALSVKHNKQLTERAKLMSLHWNDMVDFLTLDELKQTVTQKLNMTSREYYKVCLFGDKKWFMKTPLDIFFRAKFLDEYGEFVRKKHEQQMKSALKSR